MKVFLTCVTLLCLVGCQPDYSMCEFQPGQMVRSVVSGEIGQVIAMRKSHEGGDWCYSTVRFTGKQEYTNSKVLSPDGPIVVHGLIVVTYMRPYELEHVEE